MSETIDLEEKIKEITEDLKVYEPDKIILFGSTVRRDSDQYSDLDIVIIKKTHKRFLERLVEAAKLIRPQLHSIDVFVYTPQEVERMKEEESFFWEQIKKNRRIIYKKS